MSFKGLELKQLVSMLSMRKHVSTDRAGEKRQPATNRTPREINRNFIFNLVRTSQPISRADLARQSNLQASTVSLIVEGLISQGWLFEGPASQSPRGRRPILIQLDERRSVIALDIHPERITAAVVDLSGKIRTQKIIVPPRHPRKAVASICNSINALIAEHEEKSFVGIGICLPGRINPRSSSAIFAPRLKWPVENLQAELESATGLPVQMDNVANACALAEIWLGNSDANDGLVIVNVSEGIAISIFVNGKILRGYHGMAGEFGHVQLQTEGGKLCACGNRGCWETLASNTASLRYYRELTGRNAAQTFEQLLDRADKKEANALESLTRSAIQLGRGIRILLSGLAPREIVVVGDLAVQWNLIGPIVETELRRKSIATIPIIRCTDNGNNTRLRAAAALILSEGVT